MNLFARLALQLFAIYLIVDGLASCGQVPSSIFQFADRNKMPDPLMFAWVAGTSAAWVVIFSLVPAVFLMRFARSIANRLFPLSQNDPEIQVSAAGLYAVGCSLLAVWFMITGISEVTMGAGLVISDLGSDWGSYSWRVYAARLFAGIVELALGSALWIYAFKRRHLA